MPFLIVLALLLATFFVLFSLQNAGTVTIDLLLGKVESSLALILLTTLGSGILIGLLGSSAKSFSKSRQIFQQNKQIKELQKTIQEREAVVQPETKKTQEPTEST
jgi:lipopolysaccharide assembly protein A